MRKRLHDIRKLQRQLGETQDSLDIFADDYDERYEEAQERLDKLYDEEEETERSLRALMAVSDERKENMASVRELEKILSGFSRLYDRMDDGERRTMFRNLIEAIEIHPEPEGGKILKRIRFSFPVGSGGDRFHYSVECTEPTAAESKATYAQIKSYVKEMYGASVSSLYISQVKKKHGIQTGKNYNISKKEAHRVPNCPKEKEEYITKALEHFKMIRRGE